MGAKPMNPTVIGSGERRYRLLQAIGDGGFGTVYRGEVVGASGFVKPVAIKLLKAEAELINGVVERLRDEARLLALLRHRSIVGVDDLLQIDGRWAVVMEFIGGADLSQLLTLGAVPPRTACEIAREVAAALRAAHEAVDPATRSRLRIVHRDIKPANIRITADGDVKVLDFGIARWQFEGREAQTRSLSFGSNGYIAPERFEGVDTPPADVYGLGVVLLEAVNGRALGQLSVHPMKQAASVDAAVRSLPPGAASLAPLLRRCLAYDPDERPAAAEVARQLRVLANECDGPWLSDWAGAAVDHYRVRTESDSRAVSAPDSSSSLRPVPHPRPEDVPDPGFAEGRLADPVAMSGLILEPPSEGLTRFLEDDVRTGVVPPVSAPQGPSATPTPVPPPPATPASAPAVSASASPTPSTLQAEPLSPAAEPLPAPPADVGPVPATPASARATAHGRPRRVVLPRGALAVFAVAAALIGVAGGLVVFGMAQRILAPGAPPAERTAEVQPVGSVETPAASPPPSPDPLPAPAPTPAQPKASMSTTARSTPTPSPKRPTPSAAEHAPTPGAPADPTPSVSEAAPKPAEASAPSEEATANRPGTGTLRLRGDAEAKAGGKAIRASGTSLKPGTYEVSVTFSDGAEIRVPGVSVGSASVTTLECSSDFHNCKVD